jgi:hypothetical protein
LEATLERTSSEHPWWSPLGRHQRELPEIDVEDFHQNGHFGESVLS